MEVQAWMCASEEVRRCGSVEVKRVCRCGSLCRCGGVKAAPAAAEMWKCANV